MNDKHYFYYKQFILLSALFAVSYAYGGYGGYALNYPIYAAAAGPLATHTRHYVSEYPVANRGYAYPTTVVSDSMPPPINFVARTYSSPVNVQHVHVASAGSYRATHSHDAPHVRVHTVTKPIIQELREIIAPQRIVRQQVLPVQENVQTIVARQAVPVLAGPRFQHF